MDENIPLKSNSKAKRILIVAIISISVIVSIAFVYFFLYPILLFGGFFDNPPDQDQVVKLVNENIDTFEEAMEYIKTLDADVFGIKYENEKVYLNDSSYTNPEINNEAINKIFDLGVESIYIKNNNAEFDCGGAGREYYTGIIYSDSGEPNSFDLDNTINNFDISLTKAGDGFEWKEENGDNYYYCESICGKWYYYQMWW